MYRIVEGDVVEQLRRLAAASVDAIVTDPPYGLEFMGKEWDAPWKTDRRQVFDGTLKESKNNPYLRSRVRSGNGAGYGADEHVMQALQEWHYSWAREALRVLKPGGHLLAFGGSRTYHRLACALEDAGFEIRDQIMWIYGSGFPKSLDVSKAMERQGVGTRVKCECECEDKKQPVELRTSHSHCSLSAATQWSGWGTALKPAHEPIVVARKPLIGTVAANVLEHSTGALNIEGCRVGYESEADKANATPQGECTAKVGALAGGTQHDGERSEFERPESKGRWPANVIHDGSQEVVSLFPQTASGDSCVKRATGMENGGQTGAAYGAENRPAGTPMIAYGDAGSAARFFYKVRPDTREGEPSAERTYADAGSTNFSLKPGVRGGAPEGRWPANVIHDGSEEVVSLFPESSITGERSDRSKAAQVAGTNWLSVNHESTEYTDSGSAARFFYCAKADKEERERGCHELQAQPLAYDNQAQAEVKRGNVDHAGKSGMNSVKMRGNNHPTVKPIALMAYLCRLVTPPRGTVLDCFMGSGSTGIAALREGFDFIGIEISAPYCQIARRRIDGDAPLWNKEQERDH